MSSLVSALNQLGSIVALFHCPLNKRKRRLAEPNCIMFNTKIPTSADSNNLSNPAIDQAYLPPNKRNCIESNKFDASQTRPLEASDCAGIEPIPQTERAIQVATPDLSIANDNLKVEKIGKNFKIIKCTTVPELINLPRTQSAEKIAKMPYKSVPNSNGRLRFEIKSVENIRQSGRWQVCEYYDPKDVKMDAVEPKEIKANCASQHPHKRLRKVSTAEMIQQLGFGLENGAYFHKSEIPRNENAENERYSDFMKTTVECPNNLSYEQSSCESQSSVDDSGMPFQSKKSLNVVSAAGVIRRHSLAPDSINGASRQNPQAKLYRNKSQYSFSKSANHVLSQQNPHFFDIDRKIEQAMDLVKTHLMFAVREEIEVLQSRILELESTVFRLELENSILREHVPSHILANINTSQ